MGLLLLEVMAYTKLSLAELVEKVQNEFGPVCYARRDVRLTHQLVKADVVQTLEASAPATLNGQPVTRINTMDGIKYTMSDGSWLLIRPSGTEPVLRIYAEAPAQPDVEALLSAGSELGQAVITV
jgi:phosphomannomutase